MNSFLRNSACLIMFSRVVNVIVSFYPNLNVYKRRYVIGYSAAISEWLYEPDSIVLLPLPSFAGHLW